MDRELMLLSDIGVEVPDRLVHTSVAEDSRILLHTCNQTTARNVWWKHLLSLVISFEGVRHARPVITEPLCFRLLLSQPE